MKNLSKISLIIIIILTGLSEGRTQSHKDYDLLWEISGNGLESKSYLFGGFFYHDDRLFNFGDSLFTALNAVDNFASEIDIDSIYDFFDRENYLETFKNSMDAGNSSDEVEEVESSNIYVKNGKETVLDIYLGVVAKELGKTRRGLIPIPTYNGSYDYDETYSMNSGSKVNQKWVNAYSTGSLKQIAKVKKKFQKNTDLIEIEQSNEFAQNISKISKEGPTFFVIGVSHLAGEQNVIQLLESQGYELRKVGFGSKSTAIQDVYNSSKGRILESVSSKKFPRVSYMFPDYSTMFEREDGAEVNAAMCVETGLYFISSTLFGGEISIDSLFNIMHSSFKLKRNNVKFNKGLTLNGYEYREARFVAGGLSNWFRLIKKNNLYHFSFISGFSDSSLDHPMAIEVMESVKVKDTDLELKELSHPLGKIKFHFPIDDEFTINTVTLPNFKDRGPFDIYYTSYLDPLTKNEFLFRFNYQPPGILYPNYEDGLKKTISAIFERLGGGLDSFYLDKSEPYTAIASSRLSDGGLAFSKAKLRGSQILIWLQKSPNSKLNKQFFEDFELLPFTNESSKVYKGEDYQFEFDGREYVHPIDSLSNIIVRASIANDSLSTILEVLEESFTPYQTYDSSRENFILDSIRLSESGELVDFYQFTLSNGVKGKYYASQSDSSHLFVDEYVYYFNQKQLSLTFRGPMELKGSDFISDIMKTLVVIQDSTKTRSMYLKNNDLLFQHLSSRDTTLFQAALNALSTATITESDAQKISYFFATPSLDEEEEFNSKYAMVEAIHEMSSLRDSIIEYYKKTSNLSVKARIIESLALRSDSTSLRIMMDLLKTKPQGIVLRDYIFTQFSDSLLLAKEYAKDIEYLLNEDRERDYLIPPYLNLAFNDSLSYEYDSIWLADIIHQQVDAYKAWVISDTSAFVDQYIIDYYTQNDLDSVGKELYVFINKKGGINDKYLVLLSQLSSNEAIDFQHFDAIMKDPFYAYFIFQYTVQRDSSLLSKQYLNPSFQQKMIARKLLYDEFLIEAKGCEVVEEEKGMIDDLSYNLVSCQADEPESHYLTIVYPILSNGLVDLNNDKSLYFKSKRNKSDFQEDKKILLDNLDISP